MKKDLFVPKNNETVKVYEQQNAIYKDWKLERYYITKEYSNQLKSFFIGPGDIIVSCAGTIGELYILPKEAEPGIINQALMVMRENENINKIWFCYAFNNMIDKFSSKYSNGSAIKNIPPFADLKSYPLSIPTKEEQDKIADFLMLIDKKIETQNKIIEDLKLLKSSINNILYKNINGTSYKFNDLFKEYKEYNINLLNQFTIGKYGIKEMEQSNIYSTKNHLVFHRDCLILGIGIEEIGVSVNISGSCSPIYKIYNINNSTISTKYVYYFIRYYLVYNKNHITQKSTRREFEIKYNELSKLILEIPSLPTQEKYVNILESLDNKIINESSLLNLFIKQKNYLLNKMFI